MTPGPRMTEERIAIKLTRFQADTLRALLAEALAEKGKPWATYLESTAAWQAARAVRAIKGALDDVLLHRN